MMDWPYFSRDELKCKCGCGRMEMQDSFMQKIVDMRREEGFPLVVTSAYRCPEHNDRVSSTGLSGPHTTGRAIDIAISRNEAYRLLDAAYRYRMAGIGISQKGDNRFIHLDDLTTLPRPTIWSY